MLKNLKNTINPGFLHQIPLATMPPRPSLEFFYPFSPGLASPLGLYIGIRFKIIIKALYILGLYALSPYFTFLKTIVIQ